MTNRLKILNISVDPINRDTALKKISHFLKTGKRPHSVFAVNPEKNFSVPKDPVLYEVFSNADLLIPDGIGIVMAARIIHGVRLERIPGVEFMGDICHLAKTHGKKVFVFGGKERISKASVEKLQARYPGLQIAGRSNGYVPDEEMPNLVDSINRSEAEILFLALGSPKQEKWFATYGKSLSNIKICQGIGGALDTIAGVVNRAPEFWCKYHVEWLYRLLADPKRVKRQKVLPVFAAMVVISKLSRLFSTVSKP